VYEVLLSRDPIFLPQSTNISPSPYTWCTHTSLTTFQCNLTKVDATMPASFVIYYPLGNPSDPNDKGFYCNLDPFITTLMINTGHTVVQTFGGASKSERFINVTNGIPGLMQLNIRVNGKDFKKLDLDGNPSTINVDAGSVMTQDKNTITFIGRGDLGSFANVMVGDTPPAGAPSVASNAQKTGIWGPLVDAVEDNASDQAAIAAKQQIQLSLATSLDLSSAVAASHYVVTVNGGSPVSYLRVSATPSTDGTSLVLRLPTRSFVAGNAIQVNWNGLKNSKGQLLSGQVDLIAQ
jgi:hypothetical protein